MTLVIGALGLIAIVGIGALAFRMIQHTSSGPTSESRVDYPVEDNATVPVNLPSDAASDISSPSSVASEIVIINVEAGSFYFKPNEIRAKKGDKVKITMTSKDMMHNFNIDALNVNIPVTQSGKTASVEFTVNEVGEFEFYCSVGNHRKMGQVGKLIVE